MPLSASLPATTTDEATIGTSIDCRVKIKGNLSGQVWSEETTRLISESEFSRISIVVPVLSLTGSLSLSSQLLPARYCTHRVHLSRHWYLTSPYPFRGNANVIHTPHCGCSDQNGGNNTRVVFSCGVGSREEAGRAGDLSINITRSSLNSFSFSWCTWLPSFMLAIMPVPSLVPEVSLSESVTAIPAKYST